MRSFDFYEFVGVLIPGAVLLLGVGLLVDAGSAQEFLTPDSAGNLVPYLALGYVTGHLLQALGNGFETLYWKLWKGMPTDWPLLRPEHKDCQAWRVVLESFSGEGCDSDIHKWRRMVGRARSELYATGRSARLNVANGNYGMFRGLFVTEVLLALLAWHGPFHLATAYGLLTIASVLTVFRMHRFGIAYAREFFASTSALGASKQGTSAGVESNDA